MTRTSLTLTQVAAFLNRWWSSGSITAARNSTLRGEELESRCLLATFLWSYGGLVTGEWGSVNNWREQDPDNKTWDWATRVPGAGDDVIFGRAGGFGGNTDCIIKTAVEVRSITIHDSYVRNIILRDKLTIKGAGSNLNFMSDGKITGAGAEVGKAKIVLDGNTVFTWRSGTLEKLIVDVQRTATTHATVKIPSNPPSGDPPLPNPPPGLKNVMMFVDGEFQWLDQDVGNYGDESVIYIGSSGVFTCKAEGQMFGSLGFTGPLIIPQHPYALEIKNQGTVFVESDGVITFSADFTNAGKTIVNKGTLQLLGVAEQEGSNTSTFQILNDSRVTVNTQDASNILGIRQGTILGNGTIHGNLSLGLGPNMIGQTTAPVIAPGDPNNLIGTLRITGNFKMFSGEMRIDVSDATKHDKVLVDGFAALGAVQPRPGGTIVGSLLQGEEIAANTKITFLERANSGSNSPFSSVVGLGTPNSGWEYGINATTAWYVPLNKIEKRQPRVGGNAWLDNGGQPGVREAGEGGMQGVTVRLLDEAGANQIASALTDALGNFLFENIAAGVYLAEFVPPAHQRFAQANATTPDLDSDPDPANGRVRVVVYDDRLDIDAGLYSNSLPQAVSATARAHKNTPTVGNVLSGATDPDGDPLSASVHSAPGNGTVVLSSDGSFTYTPNTDFVGTDSFQFAVSDGYPGTVVNTIEVVVASTLAPVGVTDTYTAAYVHAVDAASGVLSNDTDPNNGTLRAVRARGPEHGELTLNADGMCFALAA